MADDLLNYDPAAGELPPQAPAPTPTPGTPTADTLAALADIAPAPNPVDTVRRAAFGDTGAQQYADLAAAGTMRPNLNVAPTAAPAPAAAATPGGIGPSDLMGLLGDIANGAAGHPEAGQQRALAQAQLARQQQAQQLAAQQAAQGQAKSDIDFLDKLKSAPPAYRAGLANDYFGRQGRSVPPAMAALITDQSTLTDLTSAATKARVMSDPQFAALFMTSLDKPKEFLTLIGDIRKSDADADRAVAEAQKTAAEAKAAPAKATADLANKAMELANRIRTAQKPPSVEDLQVLDSAGMTAWQVPIPGVPGGKMWTTGPKGMAPASAGADVRDVERQKAEAKAPPMTIQRAREQVGSAQNVAKDLLAKLNDPKFADAKKALGPNMTANVAGYQVGPGEFNRIWRNYKSYGGKGNTPEQNQLMEAIGYYQGTGFQAFLAGIRNQKIVEDIRVHIPAPWDTEPTIRSKIDYLSHRYDDVLQEFAKGGRPIGEEPGAVQRGEAAANAPAGTPPAGSKIIKFSDL